MWNNNYSFLIKMHLHLGHSNNQCFNKIVEYSGWWMWTINNGWNGFNVWSSSLAFFIVTHCAWNQFYKYSWINSFTNTGILCSTIFNLYLGRTLASISFRDRAKSKSLLRRNVRLGSKHWLGSFCRTTTLIKSCPIGVPFFQSCLFFKSWSGTSKIIQSFVWIN